MKNKNKTILFFTLLILGILSLTAVTVSAQDILWPWSSEPGTQPGIGNSVESISENVKGADLIQEDVHLQPDDIGYTGITVEPEGFDAIANSEDEPGDIIDWLSLVNEPQLDDNQAGSSLTGADPRWSALYYYINVTGSTLRPRDSSVTWKGGANDGCIYLASGDKNTVFNIHLDVLNGIRIEWLRFYFYDKNPSVDSRVWITRYNNAGNSEDITTVSSEGSSGYGQALSNEFEHVVDNVDYSYVLNWRPNQVGETMQLCGLRVAYRTP